MNPAKAQGWCSPEDVRIAAGVWMRVQLWFRLLVELSVCPTMRKSAPSWSGWEHNRTVVVVVGGLAAPPHWQWQLETVGYHSKLLLLLHYRTAVAAENNHIDFVGSACTVRAVHSYVSGVFRTVTGTGMGAGAGGTTSHV